jgi:hypothetical protein
MSDEIELPEPVAYLNTDCIGERYLCFSAPTGGVTENLYTADQLRAALAAHRRQQPDVSALEEVPINVIYTDGCGAGRRSPADCRYGVSYVTVADTVYWPLSADDAQRLRSAECGRGEFSGPATEHDPVPAIPSVDALAQFIRAIDGEQDTGADILAERICEWLKTTPQPEGESK